MEIEMPPNELADDLAYVRALAEEGRDAPLLGGAMAVFWGALCASAYSAHWAIRRDFIDDLNGSAYGVLWACFGVVAAIGMPLLIRRLRAKPGLSALIVRAEAAIGMSLGAGITAFAIGAVARMFVDRDFSAPNVIAPAVMALWGASLLAKALIARQGWLAWFALISFLAAMFVGALANAEFAYLVSAAVSVVIMVIPGLIMLRREPSAFA
jgi:hypothetical protein